MTETLSDAVKTSMGRHDKQIESLKKGRAVVHSQKHQHELALASRKSNAKLLFGRRKKCTKACPLFPCALASIAEANDNKCAIHIVSREERRNFIKLISGGKKGFEEEAKNLLSLLYTKIDKNDPAELQKYIDNLVKVGRFIYGDQIHTKIEATVAGMNVNTALVLIHKYEEDKKNGIVKESTVHTDSVEA